MSAWLPLSLTVSDRTFETNIHSIDEVVVRKWKVLFIRNRFDFTRLVVVSFDFPKKVLHVPVYHRSEYFSYYRIDQLQAF